MPVMTPFPTQGLPIREAGPQPIMPAGAQGNIYSDVGQALPQVGKGIMDLEQMVHSRRKAQELEALRQNWKEKEFELQEAQNVRAESGEARSQEAFDVEKTSREDLQKRTEAFYSAYNSLPPELVGKEREQAARSILASFQGQDPAAFFKQEFPTQTGTQSKPRYFPTADGRLLRATPDGVTEYVKDPTTGRDVMGAKATQIFETSRGINILDRKTGRIQETGYKGKVSAAIRQKTRGNKRTANIAKKQMKKVDKAFEKGSLSFGPLQGLAFTEKGKIFDAAVDALRTTIRKITRTPGEGSMSDLETKLTQAQLPKRTDHEAVIQFKIDNINEMIALIIADYDDAERSWGASTSNVEQQPLPQAPDSLNLNINTAPQNPNDRLGLGL